MNMQDTHGMQDARRMQAAKKMQVTLIPLLGSLHLRYPAYNAVTVRDMLAVFEPEALVITGLEPAAFDSLRWQDTLEIVLPMSIIPWALQKNLPLYPVFEPSPDPKAVADFRRYAAQYPILRQKLAEADSLLKPLETLLEQPLNLKRILVEVLPLLSQHQQFVEASFEDGPMTDWLKQRAKVMAKRMLELPHQRLAALVSIDHLPFLQEVLLDQVELLGPPQPEASEESRERSLLDFAFCLDVPEPGNLIAKLRGIAKPEARYHEANLLLAHGHLVEALDLLEQTSQGDFSEPYYLPGFLLARLAQLYDLLGKRDAALRSYRGVRALSYAPQEALELALRGLERPFEVIDK